MAQLRDLIVNGASRLIGDTYTNKIQINSISAYTSNAKTAYGLGASGQVLKTDGTNIYWEAPLGDNDTKQQLINLIYPVGSIYISVNSTSPATLFGGTWEQIENRFLLGASTDYLIGSTGGEVTHTLTIDEMPSHSHTIPYKTGTNLATGSSGMWITDPGTVTGYGGSVGATGDSQAHNNMPPYLAVNIWKRIS